MEPAKFCTKLLLFVFICKGTLQTVSGYNKFQKACVVAHNILRRAHGSQALVWSQELGDAAQKWCENLALRDELQHDNKTMDSKNQGENLAAITVMDPQRNGPSPNACVLVVGEWYGELKNYNFQTGLPKGPQVQIKHFAQVLWNNTFEIGIGTARSTVHGDIICARYSPRGAEGGPARFKHNVFADRGDSGNNFTHPLFSNFFNGLTLKQRLNIKSFSLTGGGVVGYTGSLTCGVAKSSSRIVGRQLSNKVVPWLAGLRLDTGNSRGKIFCGGSLVSSRYVLTAAHCVWQNQNPDKQLKVVLGELDPQNEDGNEMTVGVRKAINHPLFNPETSENDVSLLRLDKDVKFNDNTKPVCLPDSRMNFSAGNLCKMAGFGKIDDRGLLGMTLKTVDVHLMDKKKCGQNYGIISDTKLCTRFNDGLKDFCKEHDGSPLACDNGGKYFLAGVAGSHHNGSACAGPGFPGVYTNVKNLMEWIKQTMDNNN